MQDIRYVIVHRPGPKWDSGKSMFQQDGIGEHVAHFRQLLQEGKLMAGGPFMDGFAAGMMVPEAGVPEEEIRRFAAEDPAVRKGLLTAEVHPWFVGMKK